MVIMLITAMFTAQAAFEPPAAPPGIVPVVAPDAASMVAATTPALSAVEWLEQRVSCVAFVSPARDFGEGWSYLVQVQH